MNHEHLEWIRALEAEWSKPEGFLGGIREGVFDPEKGAAFIIMLKSISLPLDEAVDRRLVSLLWYIPSFLSWQTERVAQNGGDTAAFVRLINQTQSTLEKILGIP